VYKGVWVPHGIQVAVKKINGTNVMSEDQSALSFQNVCPRPLLGARRGAGRAGGR